MVGLFPIRLNLKQRESHGSWPTHIPLGLVQQYEHRCQRNHQGQTVAQLATGDGLSPQELYAVLNDYEVLDARGIPPHEEAMVYIMERVRIYEAALRCAPIGLGPRQVWLEDRLRDVLAAILRYLMGGHEVPGEWIDEWLWLRAELAKDAGKR